jgi:hypothetical protein
LQHLLQTSPCSIALELLSKPISQVCHTSTTKKKTQDYEGIKQFQDRWVARLPSARLIVNDISNVHQIQCAICSKVEGKEKLLVLKLDNLLTHATRHKAEVPSCGVEVGSFISILKASTLKMKNLHCCNSLFNSKSYCCKSSPKQQQICVVCCNV